MMMINSSSDSSSSDDVDEPDQQDEGAEKEASKTARAKRVPTPWAPRGKWIEEEDDGSDNE